MGCWQVAVRVLFPSAERIPHHESLNSGLATRSINFTEFGGREARSDLTSSTVVMIGLKPYVFFFFQLRRPVLIAHQTWDLCFHCFHLLWDCVGDVYIRQKSRPARML